MEQKIKILFTGGHATPAFAVLDELLKHPTLEFEPVWVGQKFAQRGTKKNSSEYQTINDNYGIRFYNLTAGKLHRAKTIKDFTNNIIEVFRFKAGFIQALSILFRENPKVIVSFGGFLAVPIVIVGRLMGKKVITHEQTLTIGLANKVIAKFANVVLISWQETARYFSQNKVKLIGNPIRQDVFEIKSGVTDTLDNNLPIIYITGGNQGAHEINKRIFEILPQLLEITNVVHQTGNSTITKDFDTAIDLKNFLDPTLSARYLVKDYVYSNEIGEIMNKSHLIISRSGANTISELLALGKMSILIPIPWASGDEQTLNAKIVENIGLAKRLVQTNNLSSQDLLEAVKEGFERINKQIDWNGNPLAITQNTAKTIVKPNAAKEFVNEITALI